MSPKRKIILSSIFFLIFVLFIFLFLTLPNLKEIKKISKEISQTSSKLEEIEKRQMEIEKFKKLSPEIKENLSKFENFLVNKEIPIDFVEFLEKMAKDLKVKTQISISSFSENSISFQIKGVSSQESVFKFIEKVENCNYLIQIERIRISKLTEAELKMEELKEFSKSDLKFEISFSVLAK
mgnify:CR=1 FL=1